MHADNLYMYIHVISPGVTTTFELTQAKSSIVRKVRDHQMCNEKFQGSHGGATSFVLIIKSLAPLLTFQEAPSLNSFLH